MKRSDIQKEIQKIKKRLAVLETELMKSNRSYPTTPISKLENRICKILNVSIKDVQGGSRMREIVNVRFVIFWVLHKHEYTFSEIGLYYNRSHATIIHGIRLINELMEINDKSIIRLVSKVSHLIDLNNN